MNSNRGFTLVELLVVLVIMGLVMTAVFGVYSTSQKTALGNEEVSSVQQNLRFAVDQMAREIRMAGFLSGPDALIDASVDRFEFETVTSDPRVVRISSAKAITSSDATATFSIEDDNLSAKLAADDIVRIFRPRSNDQPLDSSFKVDSVADHQIQVSGFDAPADTVNFVEGDLVVVVRDKDSVYPKQVAYELEAIVGTSLFNLMRRDSVDGDVSLTSNATALRFEYILASGAVMPAAPATTVADEFLDDIAAVRLRVDTEINEAISSKVGSKPRAMEVTVRLRNL